MAKKTTRKAEATTKKARTLLVKDSTGEFRVSLPPGARVTFGPDVPFQKGMTINYEDRGGRSYSLRVYEGVGNDTLCAVFAGVQWFRDMDMELFRAVLKESGKTIWKSDEKGYEVTTQVNREQSFIDASKQLTASPDVDF